MESTIAHELIHMYDMCKFKVDWADLRHHACSEVLAFIISLPYFRYLYVSFRFYVDSSE